MLGRIPVLQRVKKGSHTILKIVIIRGGQRGEFEKKSKIQIQKIKTQEIKVVKDN